MWKTDKDFTWKTRFRGCTGSVWESWQVIRRVGSYLEVVVPIICTPSSGLLLGGLEQLWSNFDQACGENTKLCTWSDST